MKTQLHNSFLSSRHLIITNLNIQLNKMANTINILKPSVCFEVRKIIGISTNDGNCKTYQVQWAPSWISGFHLVGCEDLIEQFEHEQTEEHIKIEEIDGNHSLDIIGLANRKNNDKVVVMQASRPMYTFFRNGL